MKKFALILTLSIIGLPMIAQISVKKTSVKIASAVQGHERLYRYGDGQNATFHLDLYTYNQYAGDMTVMLGNKKESLVLLQSMLDYVPESKDEMIELNNPGNNTAFYKNSMGYEQFIIYGDDDAAARIGGYLGKNSIKKFIKAILKE